MKFVQTPLAGAWEIEPEPIVDDRGWFARTFDAEEFAAHGINSKVVQCNASFNIRRDTLRGMHFQLAPHGEPKLVRCVRGAIYDVAVDLRPDSPTYCRWHAVELSEDNRRMFFIPDGMAHGFQTLRDHTEVLYQMGHAYVPDSASGVRWDDPAFAIEWPDPVGERTIAGKDCAYPDFRP